MIVYNVTIKVDSSIAENWLQWLTEEYAPQVLATGCFYKYQVLHLFEMDDSEGQTYAVQYSAHTPEDYKTYQSEYENDLQQQAVKRWGSRFVAFSTAMRIVR